MLDDEAVDALGSGRLVRRLLANALRFRLSAVSDTSRLKNLRHDADLLPEVRKQISFLLDGFHRDSHLTYDIQGLRDEGADILVRLHSPTGASRYICLQVKSHIELHDQSVVNKLQLQYSASEDEYAPITFFVILAADMTDKIRQKVVRSIQSSFKKKANVVVVEPQYTATFLSLRSSQMDAILTDAFRTGDPVLTEAKAQLSGMYIREIAVALVISSHLAVTGAWPRISDLKDHDWLSRVLSTYGTGKDLDFDPFSGFNKHEPDVNVMLRDIAPVANRYFAEIALARLLEMTDEFELEDDETLRLAINANQALYCLAFEAVVRYDLDGEALINYLLDLLYPETGSRW